MDAAVRIPLRFSDIPASVGPLPIAQLNLGGIPRGAAILLGQQGALSGDAGERMNQLAEHGYESVAADLAAAGGADHPDHALVADVGVLLDRLADRGWAPEQVGLIGYGPGARAALLAAAEYTLGAAISIGPAGDIESLTGLAAQLHTPWLGMFAGSQLADAERLGAALQASPAYTEVVQYHRVPEDFYRNPREWATYAAAFDSFQRIIEWLDAHVVPRPTPLAELWLRRQLAVGRTPA